MQVEECRPIVVEDIMQRMSDSFQLSKIREGIHITDVIYCLRKAYWDKIVPLPPTQKETLYFLTGLGLEEALLKSLPRTPAEVDGIKLSPDYYKDGTLLELKTTMMGQKRVNECDFPEGWLRQMQAYCYAYDQNQCTLLVIMLLKREHPRSFVYTFTDEELTDNWKMLRQRALILWGSLQSEEAPVEKGFEWECDSCRYRLRCSLEKQQEVSNGN